MWEGTEAKDEALETWCERISATTGDIWKYVRINQVDFDPAAAATLRGLIDGP